ncbi:MAG TPA: hypothetical protein VNJ01_00560 [Bacteriovoracaceae bacterium]|nr:hypothetical protein [Bacteriovoracaceae bacterium]
MFDLESGYYEKEAITNYCRDIKLKNKKTITFSSIHTALSKNLPEAIQNKTFEVFKSTAFDYLIDQDKKNFKEELKTNACATKNHKGCMQFNFLKEFKDQRCNSKQPIAYDENINAILNAIIGSSGNIKDPDIKLILVQQGVWVDDKIKVENKPVSYQEQSSSTEKNASPNPRKTASVPTTQQAPLTDQTKGNTSQQALVPANYTNNVDSDAKVTSVDSSSDFTKEPSKESEAKIENEILRRLLNGKKSQTSKTQKSEISRDEIKKMVEQVANENRKVPPTDDQVDQLTNNFIRDAASTVANFVPSSSGIPTNNTSSSKPTTSAPMSEAEKKEFSANMAKLNAQQGRSRTSQGMGPKQQRSIAAERSPAGPPIVIVSAELGDIEFFLSDVIDGKVTSKLEEASLMRGLIEKGNSFILKVNGIPFDISFEKIGNEDSNKKIKISSKSNDTNNVNKISREIEAFFISKQFSNLNTLDILNKILKNSKR